MQKYSCRVKFYRGRTKEALQDILIFKVMNEDEKGAYDHIRSTCEAFASGTIYSFYDMGKLTMPTQRGPRVPGSSKQGKKSGNKSATA